MPLWQNDESMVFRLEYHFTPPYASSVEIQALLLDAMQRCFGTTYRNYSKGMIHQHLKEERERGEVPEANVKPVSNYSPRDIDSIARNRFEDLDRLSQHWTSVRHTITVAFPSFRGQIFSRDGRPCTDPEISNGFDIIKSANFIEDFAVRVAAAFLLPPHLRNYCMELFNTRAHFTASPPRRYSNRSIADRIGARLYLRDMPLFITPEAVEYFIWCQIRTLPADGRLQRAVAYCCGGSEQ